MKKLTKDSFMVLRSTTIVLNEQEQQAVKGGDYWSDHGYWTTDPSGNSTWTRTVSHNPDYSGSGSSYSSSSYDYGSGSSYGSSNPYYGPSSSYGVVAYPYYAYGQIAQNPFSQSDYYMMLYTGQWKGGYVQGVGYVSAEVNIYGSSGQSNTSSGGSSSSWITGPIPNGSEGIYKDNYKAAYELGLSGKTWDSALAIGYTIFTGILINPSGEFNGNDPTMSNIHGAFRDGYLAGRRAYENR